MEYHFEKNVDSSTKKKIIRSLVRSLVSFYRFPCTYLKRKGENLFIRSLNTGRCNVCSNYAFVGVFWYISILVSTSFFFFFFFLNRLMMVGLLTPLPTKSVAKLIRGILFFRNNEIQEKRSLHNEQIDQYSCIEKKTFTQPKVSLTFPSHRCDHLQEKAFKISFLDFPRQGQRQCCRIYNYC